MKGLGAAVLVVCLFPCMGRAAELNIATLSCYKYQNEVLNPGDSTPKVDSINMVMWLFGFAVAKSGAHVMYGDALPSFGFALDAECKNNPSESLLEALPHVPLNNAHPMDLGALDCATFESRHQESARTDPESETTIMMWLLGFTIAKAGGHMFDAAAVNDFATALQAQCAKHPEGSLYDALTIVHTSKPWK
jgi:HdeA/HdeB family